MSTYELLPPASESAEPANDRPNYLCQRQESCDKLLYVDLVTKTMTDKAAQTNMNSSKRPLALVIVLLIILSFCITLIAVDSVPSKPSTAPRYTAALAYNDGAAWTVVNPASVSVAFHITNTGNAPGHPTCTVDAEDPSYSYQGFDEGQLNSLVKPGQTITTTMLVTITHQGARYVTKASVNCH